MRCLCCGHEPHGAAQTCPKCGEASWSTGEPLKHPPKELSHDEVHERPKHDPKQEPEVHVHHRRKR